MNTIITNQWFSELNIKYPAVGLAVDCFIKRIPNSQLELPCQGEELEILERLNYLLKVESRRIVSAYDSLGLPWEEIVLTDEFERFLKEAVLSASSLLGGVTNFPAVLDQDS
jgi:hypothetical protein